jgi:hypothetical protein
MTEMCSCPYHADRPAPDGAAAPARDEREDRRMERLGGLKAMRDLNMEMAVRLNDATAGRLTEEETKRFEHIVDPTLSLSRISRVYSHIVAQEEKIDTEADKRAERLKAYLAEEGRNEAARQAAREADIFEGKKRRVQRAVWAAHRDVAPDMSLTERAELLEDAFLDYESDNDYEGDPAEIVARLCDDLGFKPVEGPAEGEAGFEEATAKVEARSRAIRMAQDYLDALDPPPEVSDVAGHGRDPPAH